MILSYCFLLSVFFFYVTPQTIRTYNPVWTTPSTDVSGTMPLGNGHTAASVWFEPEHSQLRYYVARQDAWDENANLLKLNQIDVNFTPALGTVQAFNQTLDLLTATVYIDIKTSSLSLSLAIWVDAAADNVIANLTAPQAFSITVKSNVWRTTTEKIFDGSWYCEDRYTYPDIQVDNVTGAGYPDNSLVWYHRNDLTKGTFFFDTLKAQGLASAQDAAFNALKNRASGGIIYGSNLVRRDVATLSSDMARNNWIVITTTASSQLGTVDKWDKALQEKIIALTDIPTRRVAHEQWWSQFWNRSHIFITTRTNTTEKINENPGAPLDTPGTVTQQYTLWRYLQACQARAGYPIKFNGQLFVAQNGVNPDYRDWGGANWWQNSRLAYWNMFNSGDPDFFLSMFDYYWEMLPLATARTQIYFNITGAFWPETQTLIGTYYDSDYGCGTSGRAGFPVGIPNTRWNRYNYQGGLELCLLMIDHYNYFQDVKMFKKYLPIIEGVIQFYSTRWNQTDSNGKIIFFPSQAIETWQCTTYPPVASDCVTNDLPDIAGLYGVLPRLIALAPTNMLKPDYITFLKTFLNKLPPIPIGTKNNLPVFVPGEKLPASTSNSENAELYVLHPYRVVTADTKQRAINTYNARPFPCNYGWCQDVMDAALLGLTTEAMNQVVNRATVAPADGYRFPGFMPHFQDYQPSSDHLSVMNTALQWMLIQGDDTNNDVLLFPAWPCSQWNVDFKLWGPENTVVEGKYINGKLENFVVTPASRTNNVKFMGCTN